MKIRVLLMTLFLAVSSLAQEAVMEHFSEWGITFGQTPNSTFVISKVSPGSPDFKQVFVKKISSFG